MSGWFFDSTILTITLACASPLSNTHKDVQLHRLIYATHFNKTPSEALEAETEWLNYYEFQIKNGLMLKGLSQSVRVCVLSVCCGC